MLVSFAFPVGAVWIRVCIAKGGRCFLQNVSWVEGGHNGTARPRLRVPCGSPSLYEAVIVGFGLVCVHFNVFPIVE